jgi:Putative addiction module component.
LRHERSDSPIERNERRRKAANDGSAWQSLSADPGAVESPAWHEKELRERERNIESGESKFVEWEKAKADIRRRTS